MRTLERLARETERAAVRARRRAERAPTRDNWTVANLLREAAVYLDSADRRVNPKP